jgi:outer membrane protein
MRFSAVGLIVLFCLTMDVWCDPATSQNDRNLRVSVRESIVMALKNNRSLSVEHYEPDIARTFLAEEEAAFDSLLFSDVDTSLSEGQRTSGVGEFRPVKNQATNTGIGLSKQFPSGFGVDVEATVDKRSSNVYTRLFSSRVGATFTMPALRGYGSDVNLVGIHLAEKDVDITQHELRGYILALAGQVEEYYWGLLLAQEELNIHNTSLDLAVKQLTETKDRIHVGDLPEIELAAAEGEVALREEAVIDAHSAIEKMKLRFLRALNPPISSFWTMDVHLTDIPVEATEAIGTLEGHIDIALQVRPDLRQARVEHQKRELQIVRTRNGLLPQLDFFVTLGKTGYASSFMDSFSSIMESNYDARLGFVFSTRLGNRAAKVRHKRAELYEEQAAAALDNFAQLVELDVRLAYAEYLRARKQIIATRNATRLQEAKYRAEEEKFRVGKSTNILVLATQRDLIQSKLDENKSQINLRKAISMLYQSEGTLLDHFEILLPQK